MTIAVDIGNSNIVIGVWTGDQWLYTWRIHTAHDGNINAIKLELTRLWLESRLNSTDVTAIMLSSVVPSITQPFTRFCRDLFAHSTRILDAEAIGSLDMPVSRPREIGGDLVANAYGAINLYDSDCLVIDFGTALTITTVTRTNGLQGVTIAPGIQTAFRSLHQQTARLPEVPLNYPGSVIGKDTVHAMQSGVLIGYYGMIRHMIERHRQELASPVTTVATGGLVGVLEPYHDLFDHVNTHLTLDGLRLIDNYLQET